MDIDREMAERVMRWHIDCCEWVDQDGRYKAQVDDAFTESKWSPSTDITQAFKVVEKMHTKRGYDYKISGEHGDIGVVEFWKQLTGDRTESFGYAYFKDISELPMAICKAALAAVEGRGYCGNNRNDN